MIRSRCHVFSPPATSRRRRILFLLAWLGGTAWAADRLDFTWPTPNPAWNEKRPLVDFIQPTVSGDVRSGLFGCVRSSGTQFHEGIDLKPVARDRQGEATDAIVAAVAGVVRHISSRPQDSSYGRYIVLEHPESTPAVYSLYAHLAAIAPGLTVGQRVEKGQTLAVMGRSAGGYTIPKERAHLHFEFGVVVTQSFDAWYRRQKFGSPNDHGNYNGMNLMGLDPLDFLESWREGRVNDFAAYFARMEPAAVVRVASRRTPDFVLRYPVLMEDERPLLPGGWEITVNASGLPFRWKPLGLAEVSGYRQDEVRIVETFAAAIKSMRCKSIVRTTRGRSVPGRDLQTVLNQLFGW